MPPERTIHGGLPWKELRSEVLGLYYGAVPQRFATGGYIPRTTTQESSLPIPNSPRTFTNSIGATVTIDHNGIYPMLKADTKGGTYSIVVDRDVPKLAFELFNRSSSFHHSIKHVTLDGKPSIKIGDGTAAGIVYKPTTEEQAKRNLNFALANLAAYEEWEATGRKQAEAREAALKAAEKRAEEERKRREEEAEKRRAEEALQRRKRSDALAFYNMSMGTRHYSWSSVGLIGENRIQQWIDLSEAAKKLKTYASPITAPRYPSVYPLPYSNGGFDRFRL